MSGHHSWSEIQARTDSPRRRARVQQEMRVMEAVMTLHDMREQLGISQEELARAWDTSQPNVSRIEHKDDLLVSTVRRYVEALGGKLEMQAVFTDQKVQLDLGQATRETEPASVDAHG